MAQFKFTCPSCKQKIQGAEEWVGRETTCPTCKTRFKIPSQSETAVKKRTAPVPAAPGEAAAEPRPIAASPQSAGVKPIPSMEPGGQARIAVLSPEIKLEIVEAVRRLISDKSRWIPGVTKAGETVYAAKQSGGKSISVDPGSPGATQFSLMGAILREFATRNVARNAQGRRRLLDQEIPNAIKEVIAGEDSGSDQDFSTGEILGISWEQSLQALDILEKNYRARKIQTSREDAVEKFGKVRLSGLMKKMEKKLRVSPDEIVIAVFLELQEVLERLERVERIQSGRRGPSVAA